MNILLKLKLCFRLKFSLENKITHNVHIYLVITARRQAFKDYSKEIREDADGRMV